MWHNEQFCRRSTENGPCPRVAAGFHHITHPLAQWIFAERALDEWDRSRHHQRGDPDDDHDLNQGKSEVSDRQTSHPRLMFEVMANMAESTLKSNIPTPIAIAMIIAGSI